jgi:hypothetical protein
MADPRDEHPQPKPSNWVDKEFAGEHGTTASPSSVKDEKTPEFHPQNAHEAAEKVGEEAADEPGLIGKAKKAIEEVDRQIAGEYEKREDRKAPQAVGDQAAAHEVDATRPVDQPKTSTPQVAGAAVEAETERFDGLINESENPPRQPALDRENRGNGGS